MKLKNDIPLFLFSILFFLMCACTDENNDLDIQVVIDDRNSLVEVEKMSCEVYPNPFRNDLLIDVFGATDIEIRISDEMGRIKKINTEMGNHFELKFNNCADGFYYCEIKYDGNIHLRNVLKIKL